MSFFFGENLREKISHKIRMREIGQLTKLWDHPMKGIFKCVQELPKYGDILTLPKKLRETYTISIMGLALMEASKLDWWVSMPNGDPPDGFIGTFAEGQKGYTGLMREVEVVEHRTASTNLFETVSKKMTEKSYGTNTTLVCLLLTPDIYDLEALSVKISHIRSKLDHVFVVFSGGMYEDIKSEKLDEKLIFTMVQLLPIYERLTFSIAPFMTDFNDRYQQGQESRLIDGDMMYYGTTNKSHTENPSVA